MLSTVVLILSYNIRSYDTRGGVLHHICKYGWQLTDVMWGICSPKSYSEFTPEKNDGWKTILSFWGPAYF